MSITTTGADLLARADTLLAAAEQYCFADMAPATRAALVDDLTRVYLRAGDHPPTHPIDAFSMVGGRSALRAANETRNN